MKKWPLFRKASSCAGLALAVAVTGHGAQPYGQVPSATTRASPAPRKTYSPVPPSYAAAAATVHAPPTDSGVSGRVDRIERNDARQDVRLHKLEKDVSKLKPGTAGAPTAAREVGTKLYTVRPGDTLWRIAARYNTSINAIRLANRISGDTVAVGQTLAIPSDEDLSNPTDAPPTSGLHVVRPGETFSGIARGYHVSQSAMTQANPAIHPDRLQVGDRLTIPASGPVTVPEFASSPKANAPFPAAGTAVHIVKAGESLGAIAKSYGIPTATLASANRLQNPNLVAVGQRLIVPVPVSEAPEMQVADAPPPVRQRPAPSQDAPPPAGLGLTPPRTSPAPEATQTATAESVSPAAPRTVTTKPAGETRSVVSYRLEKGDDLSTVANIFGTTPAKIRELNLLSPDAELKEGDEVVVPALSPLSVN